MTTAFTLAMRTAPAAMSLAIFASGSNEVAVRSIVASMAVFTISAMRTKEMATRSAISSSFVTP